MPRSLRTLLESLPQELYDNIYDCVFTAEPATVTICYEDYRFPHLLHVDRAPRSKFAESYYKVTEIEYGEPSEVDWLETLPQQHQILTGLHLLKFDWPTTDGRSFYAISR
ncbi:hypothetical protein Slin14017_G064650 [Septoria linicola]|nr:hypothetical protein Slin14017_G064650 [Septoria linicola]